MSLRDTYDRTPLPANETFSLVPGNAVPKPLGKCVGCPQAGNAEHASCDGTFTTKTPSEPAANDTRLQRQVMRHLQWRISRMQLDAEGRVGSQPGYLFNATRSYNYADSNGCEIMAASGNTLTLRFDSDPRKLTLWQGRVTEPEVGASYINGVGGFGTIQPGDDITFDYPSLLWAKSTPSITKVVSIDSTTAVVEVDQDISRAMDSADPNNFNPIEFRAKVWQQAGNPEQWITIREPRYFVGESMDVTVDEWDSEGVITLKNSADADAPIVAPDAHEGAFKILGIRIDGTGADNLTSLVASYPNAENRVFVLPTSTTIRVGIKRPDDTDYATDLRDTYNAFRVEYIAKNPEATVTTVPCYSHCKWAHRDQSTPDKFFCARYVRTTSQDVDTNDDGITDTRQYTQTVTSGVANFPEDGNCLQYGSCDSWEPAETGSQQDTPFRTETHFAAWIRDIWNGANTQIKQGMPGFGAAANFKVHRLGHSSLHYLAGGLPLTTPPGMHEQNNFLYQGTHRHDIETYTDDDGNEYLTPPQGGRYKIPLDLTELHGLTPKNPEAWPGPGTFGEHVTGYLTHADPLDAEATVTLNAEPHIAHRIERDTGSVSGRGAHRTNVAVKDFAIIVPDVSCDILNGEQVRGLATFCKLAGPVDYHGDLMDIGGYIRFAPIRQPDKSEEAIATRIIAAVTDEGSGVFGFEFQNETRSWSFVDGPSGARFDNIKQWRGGGCWPFMLPEFFGINSYHDTQRYFGSPRAGVGRGDAVSITDTVAGYDYAPHRFTVTDAKACGGAAADTWGERIETRNIAPIGYGQAPYETLRVRPANEFDPPSLEDSGWFHGELFPPRANAAATYTDTDTVITLDRAISLAIGFRMRVVPTGEVMIVTAVSIGPSTTEITVTRGSAPAAIATGAQIISETVCRTDTGAPLTRNLSELRPASLAANEYWLDKAQGRVYFSRANSGLGVTVRWITVGQPAHIANAYTATYTIPVYAEIATGISWADWGAGNDKVLRYSDTGTPLTLQAGTAVSAVGQWAAINSSGVLNVRVHLDDAGKLMTLSMDFEEEADTPPDAIGWTNNYTEWGRDRDRIIVKDHGGLIAANPSAFVGKAMTFYHSTGQIAEVSGIAIADYGSEDFETIDPNNYFVTHDRVLFKHSFLSGLTGRKCFKL